MVYNQPLKVIMQHKQIHDIGVLDTVETAIERLDRADVSALPVKSLKNQYVGVISKSDIASHRFIELLRRHGSVDHILVEALMNTNAPLALPETASIQAAVDLMHHRHVHRLFVSNEKNQLVGVVSTSDILRLLAVNR